MSPVKPLALVIEDDASSAEALSLILRDWGADVLHAGNETDVSTAISARLAELRWIITDFHLGRGMDGVTLVQTLRKSAPQVRVLVLSGSFHGRAMVAARSAGFEVMQKPARAEAIIAWLERA